MTRGRAAVGSLLFAVGQPGVMAGLVPYWITGGWDGSGAPLALQVAGALLLAAGVAVLAHTVIRFAVEGRGTPFPAAPTENLVVGGLYRYVRNPMYLAVIAIILGQAAILGRASLLVYAAILWVTVASFVHFYEEPTLAGQYGEQYAAYRRAVRGWWPRATPWKGAPRSARGEASAPFDRPSLSPYLSHIDERTLAAAGDACCECGLKLLARPGRHAREEFRPCPPRQARPPSNPAGPSYCAGWSPRWAFRSAASSAMRSVAPPRA